MPNIARIIAAILVLSFAGVAAAAPAQQKVVYHVNDSANAMAALGNIRNHLNAVPTAKIVVVTHGAGIDFLLQGAKNQNGNDYEVPVQELSARKVEFRVCANTLTGRKIDKARVLEEATVVPSGVAEVARLQAEEGFVYIKP